MDQKNVAKLNMALMRTCRAIDFAEDQKTGWSFVEARNSVMGLKRVFQELVSAELAAQLAGIFVADLPELRDKKDIPVSE